MSGHEGTLPRAARILQVVRENTRVTRLVLDAHVDAVPGQFVMAWLPGLNERPFSLASADPVTLLVAQVGPFTTALHRFQVGDWLWWRGPFGHGFTLPELPACGPVTLRPRLLLVAGGYGVAPLAFLAQRARGAGWPVSVAIGARTREDILLPGEFATLGCQVQLCTEDGSAGLQGLVTEAVDQAIPVAPRAAADSIGMVYGCGSQAMLEALHALCHARRMPCQLCYEAVMKCALGVCGSCARDGFLVCKDGPVFAWSGEDNPASADPPTQPIRSG